MGNSKTIIKIILLVGGCTVLFLMLNYLDINWESYLRAEDLFIAAIVYVFLKAITYIIMPLGGAALLILAGTIFGVWQATLLSIVGDIFGSTVNFYISRIYGKTVINYFLGKRTKSFVEKYGVLIEDWQKLLYIRFFLSPIFDIISYLAGLSNISYKKFIIICIVGGIIPTFLNVYLGANLLSSPTTFVFALAILVVFTYISSLFSKKINE